jgi:hypothetical protein
MTNWRDGKIIAAADGEGNTLYATPHNWWAIIHKKPLIKWNNPAIFTYAVIFTYTPQLPLTLCQSL